MPCKLQNSPNDQSERKIRPGHVINGRCSSKNIMQFNETIHVHNTLLTTKYFDFLDFKKVVNLLQDSCSTSFQSLNSDIDKISNIIIKVFLNLTLGTTFF